METATAMFMILVFLLGLILMMQSNKIDEKLPKCTEPKVRNANKGLLILSVVFMTAAVAYMVCGFTSKCAGRGSAPSNPRGVMIYVGFLFLLGVTLIALGSQIHAHSSKKNCDGAKNEVTSVIVLGVVMTVMCLAMMAYKGWSSGMFAKKEGSGAMVPYSGF